MNWTVISNFVGNYWWLVFAALAVWKISEWTSVIGHRLTNVEKVTDQLSTKMDEIHSLIINKFGRSVEHSASPVTLSDYGKELSEKFNATAVANDYANRMHKETEQMNAYKVQEHCFDFCKDKLLLELEQDDKERFDEISNIAFNEGLDIEKLTRVIGIVLRDKVLELRGESHRLIDEHSPTDT